MENTTALIISPLQMPRNIEKLEEPVKSWLRKLAGDIQV